MIDLTNGQITPELMPVFLAVVLFELILKGFALWKAAKKDDKYWFIAILVLNTIGILPLIYLVFIKRDVHKS
ncbi:MAG: DUF5652 family protein [Candidatus Pacebacteria bacterium]|nr:DUF5652 family protein [Candidatus Paceibacterota bacterium]MDD3919182.1 DUF5652 family protein [Candidatus Paceibacterota bacterium]